LNISVTIPIIHDDAAQYRDWLRRPLKIGLWFSARAIKGIFLNDPVGGGDSNKTFGFLRLYFGPAGQIH